MPYHDLSQHVHEQVSFGFACDEFFGGCAELLKLLRREGTQSWQCEVHQRYSGVLRDGLNRMLDSHYLLGYGGGGGGVQIFELRLARRGLVGGRSGEQCCA